MTNSLDITLLPIVRRQGTEQPDLPGLLALSPPRRTGRGRSQDKLVMQLALQGNAPLSPKTLGKLLDSLAQTYYKATGSSTAAMRIVAESLNQSLFSRNQRGSSRGMRSLGIFTMSVFRGQRLYIAQCGATHALLIRQGDFQHFHDPSIVGRGLGMGRATPIQYHQAEIAPDDLLLISPILPDTWNQTLLRSLRGQPLDRVRSQLIELSDADIEAVLIQVAAGSGKIDILRPGPAIAEEEKSYPPVDIPQPEVVLITEPPVEPEIPDPPSSSEDFLRQKPPVIDSAPEIKAAPVAVAPISDSQPESQDEPQKTKPSRKPIIGPALLTIGRAVGTALQQFFRSLGVMIRRVLPDEKILDLPPSVMLFGALAIPLVIVSVASVVYFREGRGRMHQEKLIEAQVVAEQALPLEDPIESRAAWEQVLKHLDAAENYGSSEDSKNLRLYANSVLDNLDIVERLDYKPGIVGGLPNGVTVSKIIVNADNELYILNGESGYVLRATYTDQGYELDSVFNCGPVPQPLMVGPLIDIAALPWVKATRFSVQPKLANPGGPYLFKISA